MFAFLPPPRLTRKGAAPSLPLLMTPFARSFLASLSFPLVSLLAVILVPPLAGVEIRIATFNVRLGLGNRTNPGRVSAEAVLSRIDADIVGLQEVTFDDLSQGNLANFAEDLGYPHVFIPETALDTSSRVILLSRFPFVPGSTTSIVSPPGANDVTRAAAAATVDVPGIDNDPVVVTAHLKCCFDNDDPFRRAVEMMRLRNYLEDLQLDGEDNLFVMGDFNLLGDENLTFSVLPGGLPPSYDLGEDIPFPVRYYPDPLPFFAGLGIENPGYRQQDGFTTDTFRGSRSILDYLLVSSSVAARSPVTEIYNSRFEATDPGLPKAGDPLAASVSAEASDHYPLFGDFSLADGLPLSLSANPSELAEDSPPATLTVTLGAAVPEATLVTLQASDPSEATLTQNSLIIPAGQSTATTTLTPRLDQIADGIQAMEIRARAPGFQGGVVTVAIRDADPTFYAFQTATDPVTEDFTGFAGTQSPAAWFDGGVTWHGPDDGSSIDVGARSYGESLGVFSSDPVTFRTTLRNDSGEALDALQIAYTARHWRRSSDGSPDRLAVSAVQDGVITILPTLGFVPSTEGPTGPLFPPREAVRSTFLRGLNLLPGEEVELVFELIPGPPVTARSSDVFINEFHYDNVGTDTGEFIEVFVGEDFTGPLSQVEIQLYNGNNGRSYGFSHSLDTFVPPGASRGPRLFHKEIAGIQNGSPDGIALILNGLVKEFLSYEGSFTALDGLAAGRVSTPVGVSQNNIALGQNSIARTGAGNVAEDFTWELQPGPHTPGEVNVAQSFGPSPKPQGLAIDDLVVTPVADSDGDLLPDLEELALGTNPNLADSDRDGHDDYFESQLAGSNPLSRASRFQPVLRGSPALPRVAFPTLPGRTYRVETSTDLKTWHRVASIPGTGETVESALPVHPSLFLRVRISLP